MGTIPLVICSLVLLYATKICVNYNTYLRNTNLLGYRLWFDLDAELANLLHLIGFPIKGRNNLFLHPRAQYEAAGCEMHSSISILPSLKSSLYLADPLAIKDICTNTRRPFRKAFRRYHGLDILGRNLIVSDGEEWKIHRRIAAPAFSSPNSRLVYQATVKFVESLVHGEWSGRRKVHFNDFSSVTIETALNVFGSAAFGIDISSYPKSGDNNPQGSSMSFRDALEAVSHYFILKIAVPSWVPSRISSKLTLARRAYNEVQVYMYSLINERRRNRDRKNHDLLSMLVAANDEDKDAELRLPDANLISNIFIFLLAGHETTANTLTYLFGLLALHPEEQDLILEEVNKVCGGRDPNFDDLFRLSRVMAVWNETLRLYPIGPVFYKESTEDTSLTVETHTGKSKTVPVPKGTEISIHPIGLHYNPRYWPNPCEFKPDRFIDKTWNKDAYIPFSIGHRACIGRTFAETEGLTFIAMLVRRYRVSIIPGTGYDDPEESLVSRRERLLKTNVGLTLTPCQVPLRFEMRDDADVLS